MPQPQADTSAPHRVDHVAEWRSRLLAVVSALLFFETLSGLAIKYLPFSIGTQGMVLIHTLIGLVFLLPYGVYQVRHWQNYRRGQMSHFKMTGYLAMAATVVACVSGLVLTWQAAFALRISYLWDTVHVVSTWALIASVIPHVVLIPFRDRRLDVEKRVPVYSAQRTYGLATAAVTALLAVATGAWIYANRPAPWNNVFPEDYSWKFGEDRPFAPSLANTTTGGPFDPKSLSGSRRCGSAGCHVEIMKEWDVSAHRWAALDPAFQAIQGEMAKQNGPEATRYCAGCHDPISLFSGDKTLLSERLTNQQGLEEGVSCLACHGVRKTDTKGNANYEVAQTDRYLFELSDDPTEKWLSDFLIRAYPWQHQETLSKRLFKTSDYCAACHKQFIDEEINQRRLGPAPEPVRQLEGGEPLEPRKGTRPVAPSSAGNATCRWWTRTIPAAGDSKATTTVTPGDGKHRSRTASLLRKPCSCRSCSSSRVGKSMSELTRRSGCAWKVRDPRDPPTSGSTDRSSRRPSRSWLRSKQIRRGEEIPIRVAPDFARTRSGHDFPTGPLDIIQSVARRRGEGPGSGKTIVFRSGAGDGRGQHGRAGVVHVQGRASRPLRQPHRSPQPVGDGRRALQAGRVPRASPIPPSTSSRARARRVTTMRQSHRSRSRSFRRSAPRQRGRRTYKLSGRRFEVPQDRSVPAELRLRRGQPADDTDHRHGRDTRDARIAADARGGV